jgi:hypothetical protein
MTTITLKSPVVSVSLPEGFSEEQLLSFSPFNVSLPSPHTYTNQHNLLTFTKALLLQQSED